MEKLHYQETKPSVVSVARAAGNTFVTVCFDIGEKESGWSYMRLSLRGETTAEEVVDTLRSGGMLAHMHRSELVELTAVLECENPTDLMRTLVDSQIQAYDKSSSVNTFLFNGEARWLSKDERVGLVNAADARMRLGHANITVVLGDKTYLMGAQEALDMLARLEVYASETFLATAEHRRKVTALTLDELITYDITSGYPERLSFTY